MPRMHTQQRRLRRCLLLLTLAGILTACGDHPVSTQTKSFSFTEIKSFDTVRANGSIHVLLAGKRPALKHLTVRYSYTSDGGQTWASAVRVDEGAPPPHGLHENNNVQLAVSGDQIVAAWPTAGTGYGGTGPLTTAISFDGDKHWHPGPNPADDGSTIGHGFADMVVDPKGRFHIVWLDSRSGRQALYHTVSTDGGVHWQPNTNIDTATCQCCWTTIAARPDGGVAVLYRDIDPRDMMLAVTDPGDHGWHKRGPVGDFNWFIKACPHAGGALAITERGINAVVYTGKPGKAGLYYLFSSDGGRHWSEPKQIAGPQAKHSDLATRGDGQLAVVWLAPADKGFGVMLAVSNDGGASWHRRQLPGDIAVLSRPRIEATASGWLVIWISPTQQGSTLQMARIAA